MNRGSLRRAWAQTVKELAQFRRDPPSFGLTFFLPIAMLLIFGFAIRLEAHDVPLAVIDQDRTAASRNIVDRLAATSVFRLVPADPLHVERSLQDGSARGIVVIPPGTQRALARGESAPLQALIDGSDVVNARIVKNDVAATVAFASGSVGPIDVETRLWFNPGRREALYIVPGVYAIVLGVFPTMLAAIALVRDREEGTMLQVYSSAMSAREYLAGKITAYTLVALAEAVLLFGAGAALWGLVPIGDPTPLLVCTPLYLVSVVALGTMIGTRSRTQSAAVQAAGTVSNLPAVLFSGFLYPLNNIPPAIAWLSNFVPARYFIAVTRDAFVRGGGWGGVWTTVPALAALSLIFFLAAHFALRRMRLPS